MEQTGKVWQGTFWGMQPGEAEQPQVIYRRSEEGLYPEYTLSPSREKRDVPGAEDSQHTAAENVENLLLPAAPGEGVSRSDDSMTEAAPNAQESPQEEASPPPEILTVLTPRTSRRLPLGTILLAGCLVFALTRVQPVELAVFAGKTAALAARISYPVTAKRLPEDGTEAAQPDPVTAEDGFTAASQSAPVQELDPSSHAAPVQEVDPAGLVSIRSEAEAAEPAAAPVRPANAGEVREVQYIPGSSDFSLQYGSIRNGAGLSRDELAAILSEPSEVKLQCDGSVEVLLLSTHTTEAFEPFDCGWYDPGYRSRSNDPAANMLAVGEALAAKLRAAGVGVIHDTTVFDAPVFDGAYDRSRAAIRGWLEAYPTIRVVLDLHRDALESGGARLKPTVCAAGDGEKSAQIMLVAGYDGDGRFNMPDWRKNLRFAAALQDACESLHPGLTRPLLFDYRKYNEDLLPGVLLAEIGGHGNTLAEAIRGAELLAEGLLTLKAQK